VSGGGGAMRTGGGGLRAPKVKSEALCERAEGARQ
jgi:hypothetical protein